MPVTMPDKSVRGPSLGELVSPTTHRRRSRAAHKCRIQLGCGCPACPVGGEASDLPKPEARTVSVQRAEAGAFRVPALDSGLIPVIGVEMDLVLGQLT
jgi:hypothetical protein